MPYTTITNVATLNQLLAHWPAFKAKDIKLMVSEGSISLYKVEKILHRPESELPPDYIREILDDENTDYDNSEYKYVCSRVSAETFSNEKLQSQWRGYVFDVSEISSISKKHSYNLKPAKFDVDYSSNSQAINDTVEKMALENEKLKERFSTIYAFLNKLAPGMGPDVKLEIETFLKSNLESLLSEKTRLATEKKERQTAERWKHDVTNAVKLTAKILSEYDKPLSRSFLNAEWAKINGQKKGSEPRKEAFLAFLDGLPDNIKANTK